MKKFMLLHVGFEQPIPEKMQKWRVWFGSIQDSQQDQGGFRAGREVSVDGEYLEDPRENMFADQCTNRL